MVSRIAFGFAAAIAGLAAMASCHEKSPAAVGAAPPSARARSPIQTGSTEQPLVIRTSITYTRPRLFASPARPVAFGFVRDYRSSAAEEAASLPGAWDDVTQTLTADVTIALKTENLVYVDDPAIAPESETPIRAARFGSLPEVACPETTPPQHPCYLLQVLR
jgi:hypothetical protein